MLSLLTLSTIKYNPTSQGIRTEAIQSYCSNAGWWMVKQWTIKVTWIYAGCANGGLKWFAPAGKNGNVAETSRNLDILILRLLYSTV